MTNKKKLLAVAQKNFVNYLRKQNKASATILAYGNDIAQLIEFLQSQKITQVTSINQQHLENFKKELAKRKYNIKSIARKTNSIKAFFRYLKTENLVSKDPSASLTHPHYEATPPRIFSKMEYRALRDAARNEPRTAAIIELLLQTGMRISELARLELKDISEKEIKIRAYETHPERTVPLNQAARRALERYLKIRPKTKTTRLFITRFGRPFLVRNMRTAIKRFFQVAGIKNAKINDLRHTFIAHQLMNGAPLVFVQKLVGHKRLTTTERYLSFISKKEVKKIELKEL